MRTTVGNIRRLLNEVHNENIVNEKNVNSLIFAAKRRIDKWWKEKTTKQFFVNPTSKKMNKYGTHGCNAVEIDGSNITLNFSHRDWHATVFVDLTDPLSVTLRSANELNLYGSARSELEDLMNDLKDVSNPSTDESGNWWADENYYPIRPIFDGEDPNFKPDWSWTIVNGMTGDVVEE